MSETAGRVVIIGAGQAGGECAFRLRQLGFKGSITLVGAEPLPPYQRPPLSKKYLAGEWDAARLALKPAEAYADAQIELKLSAVVSAIDRASRTVATAAGARFAYDHLVIATGSRARELTLPGAGLAGVHVLRTAADVDAIRAGIAPGKRMVIIGAGYIGLETAAVARSLGMDVSVLEAAPRPLARVTSPEVSAFFVAQHEAHGVKFRLGARIAAIEGATKVESVALEGGERIDADIVIAGIGILPETEMAEAAGIRVDNGIVVDRMARTSDPAVFAIGDCARRPLVHYGREGRLESVHNALEGAKIAAAMIVGAPPPVEEAPWFWSDQYDLKLQIAGLFTGYDELVLRGDPASKSFAAFYLAQGRLIAVDAVNRPAEFLGGRQLILKGARVAAGALADEKLSFKEIMAQTA